MSYEHIDPPVIPSQIPKDKDKKIKVQEKNYKTCRRIEKKPNKTFTHEHTVNTQIETHR